MDRDRVVDVVFKIFLCVLTALGLAPALHMIFYTIARGAVVICRTGVARFLTDVPPPPGTNELGGIGPALLGTAILTAISIAIGVPLALALAILATEFSDTLIAKIVRFLSKAMMGVPTIAISMLVYTLIVVPMGGASALAGGIALAIVLLPYATTYIETCLESVPVEYREAGFALGMKKREVVTRVVLSMCRRCIAIGIVLSVARALGETSPLLFTAGSAHYVYPKSLTDPASSITLLIFEFGLTPFRNLIDVAWGAALVLIISYFLTLIAVRFAIRGVEL